MYFPRQLERKIALETLRMRGAFGLGALLAFGLTVQLFT
jgi:hypothetical protein